MLYSVNSIKQKSDIVVADRTLVTIFYEFGKSELCFLLIECECINFIKFLTYNYYIYVDGTLVNLF